MGCPLQKKLILTRISHLVCVWVSCSGRLTLCDLTDCRPPSSAVHVDSQGKNTGVVAMPSFRGSSQPRDQTCVFCLLHRQVGSLALAPPGNSISQNAKYKIKKKKKKQEKKSLWPWGRQSSSKWHQKPYPRKKTNWIHMYLKPFAI